jgi:hypothetical protein
MMMMMMMMMMKTSRHLFALYSDNVDAVDSEANR